MMVQSGSTLDQAAHPMRRTRISVYLEPHGPLPADVANLPDELDVTHIEKIWRRSLFVNATLDDAKVHHVDALRVFLFGIHGPKPVLRPIDSPQEVVVKFRDVLRQAWQNDTDALDVIRFIAGDLRLEVADNSQLKLVARDLWAMVCILFMVDHAARRLALCANPNCEAKFFVRSRRTQKYCDLSACFQEGHRIAARKWWDAKGQQKRAKKGKKK
jgi:hypothetical protein